jgi:hypothetical protein
MTDPPHVPSLPVNVLQCGGMTLSTCSLIIGILAVLFAFVYFRFSSLAVTRTVTECGDFRPEKITSTKGSEIKDNTTTATARKPKDGQVIVSKILIYPIKVCCCTTSESARAKVHHLTRRYATIWPFARSGIFVSQILNLFIAQSCRGISVQSIKYAPEGLEVRTPAFHCSYTGTRFSFCIIPHSVE